MRGLTRVRVAESGLWESRTHRGFCADDSPVRWPKREKQDRAEGGLATTSVQPDLENGSAEPFGDGNAAILILVKEAEPLPPSVESAFCRRTHSQRIRRMDTKPALKTRWGWISKGPDPDHSGQSSESTSDTRPGCPGPVVS